MIAMLINNMKVVSSKTTLDRASDHIFLTQTILASLSREVLQVMNRLV